MYGNIGHELDGGGWAQVNPSSCPCHGNGWMLSDFDTWHRCPVHGQDVPHPECDADPDVPDDVRRRRMYIASFRYFRDQAAKMINCTKDEANEYIRPLVMGNEPSDWVNAAETVAESLHAEALDERARNHGYSCALEARWATAAHGEREGIAMGMSHEDAELHGIHNSSEWV